MENRLTLDTEDSVYFYEQDFYVLSNFSSFKIYWKGLSFDTVEHAYHWMKFAYADSTPLIDIRTYIHSISRSAHDAFQYAQKYKELYDPKWDDKKFGIMKQLLITKVQQHPYVKKKLLETGDRYLVENSWRDGIWGWGQDRGGLNMLGRIWMEVRADLRAGLI